MANLHVGRAYEKLEYALGEFQVEVAGKVCADFGSNVGGFVECLLKHGAVRVYAVETGYGVLDYKLRIDPRVVVMERTNAMHVILPEKVNLISIDTSWTKQKYIVPNAIKNLKPEGEIVVLIKPQYEADERWVRGGKIEPERAELVARQLMQELAAFNLDIRGPILSPITGNKAGNYEYLAYLRSHAMAA